MRHLIMSKAVLGRPTKYNAAVADQIIHELATTMQRFEDVCVNAGICLATGMNWLNAYPDFLERYLHAREMQTEIGFDEMRSIADAPLPEVDQYDLLGNLLGKKIDAGVSMAEMQRRKLQIDVIKFKLVKLQPKRFGDNRNVDVNVKVQKVVSGDQFQQLVQLALAAPKAETTDDDYEEAEIVSDAAADFDSIAEDDEDFG